MLCAGSQDLGSFTDYEDTTVRLWKDKSDLAWAAFTVLAGIAHVEQIEQIIGVGYDVTSRMRVGRNRTDL